MSDDPWRDTTWAGPTQPGPDAPPDRVPASPSSSGAVGPPVAWQAPEPTGRAFGVGEVIADVFAYYGADPLRLLVIAALPAVLGMFGGLALGDSQDLASLGPSLALTLVGALIGLVAASVIFVLLDAGRLAPLAAALRAGIVRSGRLLLAGLAIGGLIIGLLVLIAIPAALLAAVAPILGGLALIAGGLVAGWASLRLVLAIPAVVVDRLGVGESLRTAWQVSRPAGVWLRFLACALIVGLLTGPASFAGGVIGVTDLAGSWLQLLVLASIVFVAPVGTILYYAAYRRLVPRAVPASPAEAAEAAVVPDAAGGGAEIEGPDEIPSPPIAPQPLPLAPRPLPPPILGAAGKAILVATVGLAVVSLTVGSWTLGQVVLGTIGVPGVPGPSRPAAGVVEFGASANLASCTVTAMSTRFGPTDPMVWLIQFPRRATFADEVRIRITRDGEILYDDVEERGTFDCLGTDEPVVQLEPGRYAFTARLNGDVVATGEFIAQ
jgi:hypothetical protein